MADKSVGELIAAQSVTPTDLFVLEQNGTAKKLTGQILENWLVSFADGHGGIQSIAKLSTSGLVDTYRITLADTTTFDFVVNNGKGITGISKTGTSGLIDTYTISYNDGTSGTLTVTNGEKGDKGDNAYIWIKYASQEPTESSHSMGDIPDNWIGIYSGNASTAPTDWQQYKWFQIKGEKGDTGDPATITSQSVTYQASDSGTIIPSGTWVTSVPVVGQGKYLWTRTEITYNTGSPVVSYSVSRMGIDGTGAVSSVAGVSPDSGGNVALTAADVGALPFSGGTMTGAINMNGQPISGLNDPTEDTQAARKGYVDKMLPKSGGAMTGPIAMGGSKITDLGTPTANTDVATKGYVDTSVAKAATRNLLDNSDFRNPVNQRGKTAYFVSDGYGIDRWLLWSENAVASVSVDTDGIALNPLSDPSVNLGQRFQKGYFSNDRTYTLAYLDTTGEIHIRHNPVEYGDSFDWIDISSSAWIKLVWAALYEGEYTAENLPVYHPKGHGEELAECQRYYYQTDGYMAFTLGAAKAYAFAFPRMRITPAVTIYNSVSGVSGGVSDFSAGGNYPATLTDISANTVAIRVDSGASGNTYLCKLIVNADL